MSMAHWTSEVTLVIIWYIHPPHHGHSKGNVMVMNGGFTSTMSISPPIHEIRLFQSLTLKLQVQGDECGQRARSCSQSNMINFLFTSHQSNQQFLRYSFFKIWPWKILGQGHGLDQNSRSHSLPHIKPKHFLFISHQLDQPFQMYG